MKTKTSPRAVLESLPAWKNCIHPWMNGKRIGDAPTGFTGKELTVYPAGLTFDGPFAAVHLRQLEDGKWLASVTRCANPATETFTDLKKAVRAWAGSVWHTAIRGVIG